MVAGRVSVLNVAVGVRVWNRVDPDTDTVAPVKEQQNNVTPLLSIATTVGKKHVDDG